MRNRQAKNDCKNKDELLTKSVKAVTEDIESKETDSKMTLEINYQTAAADAINKVKQDLATKETGDRKTAERPNIVRGRKLT